MSLETPQDPLHRHVRARVFQQIVSRLVIDDCGAGPIVITIEANLVPDGAPVEAGNPLLVAASTIDGYASRKAGKAPADEHALAIAEEAIDQIQTDLSSSGDKSVWTSVPPMAEILAMPSETTLSRLRSGSLDSTKWRKRREHSLMAGTPAWQTTVRIPAGVEDNATADSNSQCGENAGKPRRRASAGVVPKTAPTPRGARST